jgi:hypothetical protein
VARHLAGTVWKVYFLEPGNGDIYVGFGALLEKAGCLGMFDISQAIETES